MGDSKESLKVRHLSLVAGKILNWVVCPDAILLAIKQHQDSSFVSKRSESGPTSAGQQIDIGLLNLSYDAARG